MIYVLRKWIRKDDLRSVTAVIVLGSLCHFLYDWSGGLSLAALFCPVNESVWEHLKLLYFPFLLVSLVSFRRSSPRPDLFFYSRFLGVLPALLFILASYYTYTGILGRHFLLVDLILYVCSVFAAFAASSYFYRNLRRTPSVSGVVFLWIALAFVFFIFTGFPPNLPLLFPPDIV